MLGISDRYDIGKMQYFYFCARVYLIILMIVGGFLNIKSLVSLREAAKVSEENEIFHFISVET